MDQFFKKTLQKIALLYCIVLTTSAVQAQVSIYPFSQTVETFTPITGDITLTMVDDSLFNIAIPTFTYNNTLCNTATLSSNGFLILGNQSGFTKSTYTPLTSSNTALGVIAPFARDLMPIDSTSKILIEQVGNEFVVQWTHVRRNYSYAPEDLTFQLRIDTVTNIIRFVYGQMTPGPYSGGPQVGLRGSSSSDISNRMVTDTSTTGWINSKVGTYSYSTCYIDSNKPNATPISGTTFQWTPATCFTPIGLTNTAISINTASFSWNNSFVNGQIAIYPANSSLTNATITSISATNTTLSNLEEDKKYLVQIREVCAAGDTSNWSSTLAIKTPCSPITNLPWYDDLESIVTNSTSTGILGALPNTCWAYRGDIAGADAPLSSARRAHSGSSYLYTTFSTAAGTGDVIYTPGFHLDKDTSYTFSFWYKSDARNWDTLRALVGTLQDATIMQVIGTSIFNMRDSSTYHKFTAEFTPTNSGTYYFGANIFAGYLVDYFCFDDFKVEKTPTCVELPLPTVGAITSNTVELSWTTTQEVELLLVRHNQAREDGRIISVAAGNTSYIVDSLIANTNYKVYIRQICAVGDTSDWSTGAATFITDCGVLTAPWFEDFESVVMPSSVLAQVPACWAKTGDFEGASTTGPNGRTARSGNNYLHTKWTTISNIGDNLYSPAFELQAGQVYTYSFWYAKHDATGVFDSIRVGVVTDQAGNNLQYIGTSVTALSGIVPYTQYSVEFIPTTTGIYHFVTNVWANTSPWYLAFDDFSLDMACESPTLSLNVTNACDTDNGSISVDVTGGNAPYTYEWSNGSTNDVAIGLIANQEYFVTVTEANGCTATLSALVHGEQAFSAAITTTNATCPTCSDGSIDLIVIGAIEPATYEWSNGEISQNLTNLLSGNYQVTITNGNGCQKIVESQVLADTETSITENSLANNIRLYPNPTSSIVTLEGFENSTQILIVNNLGQIVMQTSAEQNQIQIDLSTLAPATYWIRMQSEKGSAVLPIIKAQ